MFKFFTCRSVVPTLLVFCICCSSKNSGAQVTLDDLKVGFKQNLNKFYEKPFRIEWKKKLIPRAPDETDRMKSSLERMYAVANSMPAGLGKKFVVDLADANKRIMLGKFNTANEMVKSRLFQWADGGYCVRSTTEEKSLWSINPDVAHPVGEDAIYHSTEVVNLKTNEMSVYHVTPRISAYSIFSLLDRPTSSFASPIAFHNRDGRKAPKFTTAFDDIIYSQRPIAKEEITVVDNIAKVVITEDPVTELDKGSKIGSCYYIEFDMKQGFIPRLIQFGVVGKVNGKAIYRDPKKKWTGKSEKK